MKKPFSYSGILYFAFLLSFPINSFAQDYSGDLSQAVSALKIGEYKKARGLFKPLVDKVTGDDREAVMGYFETFLEVGEYAGGLKEVESYLQKSPEDPYLLNIKGRFHVATGKYEEAQKEFAQARIRKFDYWRNILDLAELFDGLGRKWEASGFYNELIYQYRLSNFSTPEHYAYAARAFTAIGKPREALEAFTTANKLDKENVMVLQWWGRLFEDKFNPDQAQANFEEAMAINPNKADLYTDFARSTASFAAIEDLANKALGFNPNSVEARNLLAKVQILDSEYEEAERLITEALAINPNSQSSLAYLAVIHHLRDEKDKFKEIEQRVISLNPNPGDFYYIIADNCVRRFRYKDAVQFGYNAIARDPVHWKAYALVGTNLLRLGRVREAKRYLDRVFTSDPYNVFAVNTLNLIDDYVDFETLESENFILIIHKSESGVLGKAILDLAEENYKDLSARYPYKPEDKIRIEAYNDHADFAVRIGGLPGIQLLGVCFGDVLAFDTPKARFDYAAQMGIDDSNYNWQRTLWHEIAHVMALGLSDHRVPRWFTEGLAVYEEKRAFPEWARDMELEFFSALDRDKLLTLAEINKGFTRPQYAGQIMLTYYQSSRLIEFISDKYGFKAVSDLLIELGKGSDLEKSFQEVLKESTENVENEFFEKQREELPKYKDMLVGLEGMMGGGAEEPSFFEKLTGGRSNPFFDNLSSGYEALREENYADAEQRFIKAKESLPTYVEPGNPYVGLAGVYRSQGRTEDLQKVLEEYLMYSEFGADEAIELAEIYLEQGDPEKAEYYFNRSLQVQPYNINTYLNLADIYVANLNYSKEIEQRRILVALDPIDKSKAFYNLALSLYNEGQKDEAKKEVLKSLEIAPSYGEALKLLLKCIQD